MNEYSFELCLCAYLERTTEGIIARQVGGGAHDRGRRILDVVLIEPGPGFDDRAAITTDTIPAAAIESEAGPGRWRRWPQTVDIPAKTATRILEEAIAVGFFEHERRAGSDWVRQVSRYPDWIGGITAIENKPDLGSPGALCEQLRQDVSLGLVDRVILATASHVTRAHLNRIPREVGVWRVRFDEEEPVVEELRNPEPLDPEAWGLEVVDAKPTRTRIRPVDPEAKRRARISLAERTYGKGWRPRFPACAEARVVEVAETASLPHCDWKKRIIDPVHCGPSCPRYDHAKPPAVDRTAERERNTPWTTETDGIRQQSGLSDFC